MISPGRGRRLRRAYYERPTLDVARELIGQYLVYDTARGQLVARIVETEAYIGESDPACHAAPGPTQRNQIMYGRGGFAYVYIIYGMYYCLNIVTEKTSFPAAVLIRAAEPIAGAFLGKHEDGYPSRILSGPGKLCREFGLTTRHTGIDLTKGPLYVKTHGENAVRIGQSLRIGIRKGLDRFWRFYDVDSWAVTQHRPIPDRKNQKQQVMTIV